MSVEVMSAARLRREVCFEERGAPHFPITAALAQFLDRGTRFGVYGWLSSLPETLNEQIAMAAEVARHRPENYAADDLRYAALLAYSAETGEQAIRAKGKARLTRKLDEVVAAFVAINAVVMLQREGRVALDATPSFLAKRVAVRPLPPQGAPRRGPVLARL